jgi:hypothetical protein
MVLVYKGDAIAGLMGALSSHHGSPRAYKDEAMQLIVKSPKMKWVTKNAFIKYIPYTVFTPTAAQAKWRLEFIEASKEWKGKQKYGILKEDSRSKKHKAGDEVLAVQAAAQVALKAKHSKVAAELQRLSSKAGRKRYNLHTVEDLKKLAGEA